MYLLLFSQLDGAEEFVCSSLKQNVFVGIRKTGGEWE